LFFFSDNVKSKKKGSINIKDVISVSEVAEHVHKKLNCFAVVTPKKTYFLYTDTVEVMKAWIRILTNK
jgi:hypothetical protein